MVLVHDFSLAKIIYKV